MKKLNSILSIISLCITSMLLVLLVFAWYATNKTANVNDGVGMVATQPSLVEHVDYYNFVSESEGTYTVGTHIRDSGTCNMQKYAFPAEKPTYYYIRIQLRANTAINQVRFISSATHFVGFASRNYIAPDNNEQPQTYDCNDSNGVLKVDNRFLSLSSVIKFYYLGTTNSATTYMNANNTAAKNFVINENNWMNFQYNSSTGAITASTINVLGNSTITATNESQYIHLLLDYNVLALNEFYGNNLANQTLLSYHDGPEFTNTDFIIHLLG